MIRDALPADIFELLEIQAAWPSLPRWSARQFEEELGSETARLVVWEESRPRLEGGPLVAGYACLRWVRPEAEVLAVAVRPDRLRRGIGRKLLARLHALAIEERCLSVQLEVGAANAAALRLYSSAGYAIVGRRPKYYNDASDALLMSLRLP